MGNVDEDLIEATIRRVAAAKAAQGDDDAPEIDEREHEEASLGSQPAPAPVAAVDDDPVPAAGGDDDLIEATIRRVAAQKAALQAAAEHADDDVHAEAPAAPAPPTREAPAAIEAPPPAPEAVRVASVASTEGLTRIEQALTTTAERLEAIASRLDWLLPLIEQSARPASDSGLSSVRAQASGDDDWDDDVPQISRMPIGAPPRPAILRDPSPQTATAEHLVEAEMIDTRPLPKPLPPIHVEPKRGLDLLPRGYRITVEDKRRGVDLVPLHRALLSMDGVKDMSLLSYNNGVAIVSLETTGEIDPETLGQFVSRAMSREARVEVHNEHTMVVKLAED